MLKQSFSVSLILQLLFTQQVWSQGLKTHNLSKIPEDSRFEIVQSSLTAKHTFKVDKYNGNTFQLLKDSNGDLFWLEIGKASNKLDVVENRNKVNYQIFTSGIAARHTYLININTGASYVLLRGIDDVLYWSPIF